MRTLFDVLEGMSNATQAAVLKFIAHAACIRAFYACLFETEAQVWVDVEAKARDSILPRCKTPFDMPEAPSELLNLVITNKLRVIPIEFITAQAEELDVNVDELIRLNQSLQKMEQDELVAYSEDVLQKYSELTPQEVKFKTVPTKIWLILAEKALLAIEFEKQQIIKWASMKPSDRDLAAIQMFNGEILEIQGWIREVSGL